MAKSKTIKTSVGKFSTKGVGKKKGGLAAVSHGKTTTLKRPKAPN